MKKNTTTIYQIQESSQEWDRAQSYIDQAKAVALHNARLQVSEPFRWDAIGMLVTVSGLSDVDARMVDHAYETSLRTEEQEWGGY